MIDEKIENKLDAQAKKNMIDRGYYFEKFLNTVEDLIPSTVEDLTEDEIYEYYYIYCGMQIDKWPSVEDWILSKSKEK